MSNEPYGHTSNLFLIIMKFQSGIVPFRDIGRKKMGQCYLFLINRKGPRCSSFMNYYCMILLFISFGGPGRTFLKLHKKDDLCLSLPCPA